ncbi:protein FAM220A [Tupaia chinensis]|uniref:protein FAM220A n=1 Tax=Tupaia chinensis TaxID=246437 RepID=UPI0003C8FDA3|nr:protein FAM220A [Tupaia chinensis]
MRDSRETLGTCLARVKGGGGDDSDLLLYSLKKRTQEENPHPADMPSWINQLAVDVNGNSHNEAFLEMKNDLSEADLSLHDGHKVFPYLKESVKKNLASAAVLSKSPGLLSVPAEDHFAGLLCGAREDLERDWLEKESMATDNHKGHCPKGEPQVSGLPCHQKLLEMGIFKDEPPSAFPAGLVSVLVPSCLRSVLFAMLHACPQVLLNHETKHIFLDHLKPMFLEPTVEYKKMLSSVKSISNGLQVTLGLLTL